jgi:hypothetical protein
VSDQDLPNAPDNALGRPASHLWNPSAEPVAPPLLPCPFCGNAYPNVVQFPEDGKPNWRVVCLSCLHSNRDSEAQAVAAWNRRPGSEMLRAWADNFPRLSDDVGPCLLRDTLRFLGDVVARAPQGDPPEPSQQLAEQALRDIYKWTADQGVQERIEIYFREAGRPL